MIQKVPSGLKKYESTKSSFEIAVAAIQSHVIALFEAMQTYCAFGETTLKLNMQIDTVWKDQKASQLYIS